MRGVWRGLMLLMLAVTVAGGGGGVAWSQALATTTVEDTVYSANGTPAAGSVVVTWGAFTTANGVAVPAGTTAATIGAGGVVTVSLAPNAGATPMGSYYTAVFHLNDGTTSKEFWVVPVAVPGGGPAKLAAIRNQVLPASVAMQTVSKQYVDNEIAQAQIGAIPLDQSPYVVKTGDTMTGPLVLPGDPATPNQAADKNYVDTNVAQLTAGLAGKVSLLPSTTQVVSQPAGTQLEVNRLNGVLDASQFVTQSGGSVSGALSQPDCGTGCMVVADAKDPANDVVVTASIPDKGQVLDQRGGAERLTSVNPVDVNGGTESAQVAAIYTRSQPSFAGQFPGTAMVGQGMVIDESAVTGGSNLDPQNIEAPPYFKNTYSAMTMRGLYSTEGQHVQFNSDADCFGVGDCLMGSQVLRSSGGLRDPSDEGTHPYDLQTIEDTRFFVGTCASGCTTGSTSVEVAATAGAGTEGEGRFLIDLNPAKVISTGTLIAGYDATDQINGAPAGPFAVAQFSGTNFAVSVFLATASAALSQPANVAPGTVTVPIATTGVPAGFATNTAALPAASGVACVADADAVSGPRYPNFEMVNYTVVDGTHVQVTLRKPHGAGAVIAVGGLCGYGLEQKVDSFYDDRQIFPVVGSPSATTLFYADAGNASVARGISQPTSNGFANLTIAVASGSRSGNVVTLTLAQAMPQDLNGLSLTVSGVADTSFDGTFPVTTTSLYTLTYTDNGPDSTSTGGQVSLLTGGFALYPMAEVVSVYDPVAKAVTGLLTLSPNTAPWATGDAVEEPHFYMMYVYPDAEYVQQVMPRPFGQITRPGKIFQGAGPGMNGWDIQNVTPASTYFGGGGTHQLPDAAYVVEGPWQRDIDVQAGAQAVLSVHCNLHGCNRYDSAYNLAQMDSANGVDTLSYDPSASGLTIWLKGFPFRFTPTGFQTDFISTYQLTVQKLVGNVDAGALTTGTIDAARLPIFGPSGPTHAPGAVPDPGAVAGNTRYLREDGTWSVPVSTGGGTGGGGGSSSVGATGAVQTANGSGGLADSGCVGTGSAMQCKQFSLQNASGAAVYTYITSGIFGGQPTIDLSLNHTDYTGFYVAPGKAYTNGIGLAAGSGCGPSASGICAGTSGQFTVNDGGNVSAATVSATTGAGAGFQEALYTPASSTAACTAGQFADDANFHYVCVAANTWKRVALSSF